MRQANIFDVLKSVAAFCAVLLTGFTDCESAPAESTGEVLASEKFTVVVTQNVCHAFGSATNKKIDRMRLERAALKKVYGTGTNLVVCGMVKNLSVVSVAYISSNKVEGVFVCGRISYE